MVTWKIVYITINVSMLDTKNMMGHGENIFHFQIQEQKHEIQLLRFLFQSVI